MILEKWFGIIVTYWDLGTGKVISRFQTSASIVLMVFTLLAVYGYKFGIIEFIGFAVVIVLISFFLGVVYNRLGLYKYEISKSMAIHPYYKNQQEQLDRIEKLLQKDKA